MNSFLELNWLARADKDILLPPVVFADTAGCSGFCQYPRKGERLIGDRFYPLDRGLIVVGLDSADVANTLAHEWRHLWQVYNKGEWDPKSWDAVGKRSYKTKIVEFFKQSGDEMDALLFSLKKAPDEVSLLWHEWIVKSQEQRNNQ